MKKYITTFCGIALASMLILNGCHPISKPQITPPTKDENKFQQPASGANTATPQAKISYPGQRTFNKTPNGNGVDLFFIDSDHGWKMTFNGFDGKSGAVTIYQTVDGAKSWNKVAVADKDNSPTSFDVKIPPAGYLPYEGDKTGINFVNTSTGWATGISSNIGNPWFYVTPDGGHIWKYQDIPVPFGCQSSKVALSPPTFFTEQYGIIQMKCITKDSSLTFLFLTNDGGQHWGHEKKIPGKGEWEKLKWEFGSPDNGTVVINGVSWFTPDGGYTWTKR